MICTIIRTIIAKTIPSVKVKVSQWYLYLHYSHLTIHIWLVTICCGWWWVVWRSWAGAWNELGNDKRWCWYQIILTNISIFILKTDRHVFCSYARARARIDLKFFGHEEIWFELKFQIWERSEQRLWRNWLPKLVNFHKKHRKYIDFGCSGPWPKILELRWPTTPISKILVFMNPLGLKEKDPGKILGGQHNFFSPKKIH